MAAKFDLGRAYLYLVSLIMLIISIVAVSGLVRAAVSVVYPDPYLGSAMYCANEVPAVDVNGEVKPGGTSKSDCERQAEIEKQARERNTALDLVGSGTLLAIAGPLYLYHWRRVSQERREDRENAARDS